MVCGPMTSPSLDLVELVVAARELAGKLENFEVATDALQRLPLDSQKNLERSAHALSEIATLDEELVARVQTLVAVFTRSRERQQAQALAIQKRAEQIKERTEVYQQLLARFGALGQHAGSLNQMMQQMAIQKGSTEGGASFADLQRRMDQVVDDAQAVTHLAQEKDFSDVSRQADSLRQQLLAARNKLTLLHQKLSSSEKS